MTKLRDKPKSVPVKKLEPVVVHGLAGFGDNIYQRPTVRAICQRYETWLVTPWPQLYWDLIETGKLKVVKPETKLRTQLKNMGRVHPEFWSNPSPRSAIRVHLGYSDSEIRRTGGIARAIERRKLIATSPLDVPDWKPGDFCQPLKTSWEREADRLLELWQGRPFALYRPPTVRREWPNAARNPDMSAMQVAIDDLKRRRLLVVSVADIDPPHEDLAVPEVHGADIEHHLGEIAPTTLLALMRRATITIGGVGWIVPAGLALNAPMFALFGGNGAHNTPTTVFDVRMNIRRFGFVRPEPQCLCGFPTPRGHVCQKAIPAERVSAALDEFFKRLATL